MVSTTTYSPSGSTMIKIGYFSPAYCLLCSSCSQRTNRGWWRTTNWIRPIVRHPKGHKGSPLFSFLEIPWEISLRLRWVAELRFQWRPFFLFGTDHDTAVRDTLSYLLPRGSQLSLVVVSCAQYSTCQLWAFLKLSLVTQMQGIDIGGLKVLLSVYSKDKGRPGREGLVWEVYNQETCARCILHLSSSNLLEQVNGIYMTPSTSWLGTGWQGLTSQFKMPGFLRLICGKRNALVLIVIPS